MEVRVNAKNDPRCRVIYRFEIDISAVFIFFSFSIATLKIISANTPGSTPPT